jgi:hypothetical protein
MVMVSARLIASDLGERWPSRLVATAAEGCLAHSPDWLKIAPQPPYSFFANLPTIFWFQSNPVSS